jgi:hypothetical protein
VEAIVLLLLVILACAAGAALLIHRGFRATTEPSRFEAVIARTVRDFSIPDDARRQKNPLEATQHNLDDVSEKFLAVSSNCHGRDGSGMTPAGQSLYPCVPDLRSAQTQNLTDGEIHYIIENGVPLTGMPASGNLHRLQDDDSWKLVLDILSLRPLTRVEHAQQAEPRWPPVLSARKRAPSAALKSTSTGRRRPWPTSCAILDNIPTRSFPISPSDHLDYVAASDTCIQYRSQGQPLSNPIQSKYYD